MRNASTSIAIPMTEEFARNAAYPFLPVMEFAHVESADHLRPFAFTCEWEHQRVGDTRRTMLLKVWVPERHADSSA